MITYAFAFARFLPCRCKTVVIGKTTKFSPTSSVSFDEAAAPSFPAAAASFLGFCCSPDAGAAAF